VVLSRGHKLSNTNKKRGGKLCLKTYTDTKSHYLLYIFLQSRHFSFTVTRRQRPDLHVPAIPTN